MVNSKMRVFLWCVVFLGMTWGAFLPTGKTQAPILRNFSVEHGLPSSNIYEIRQNRAGHIYFATDQGLAKFNGYKFTNLTVEDGLPDNDILLMYIDRRERIWLGTFNGKVAYVKNGKVTNIKDNKAKPLQLISFISSFAEAGNGDIWIGNTIGEMLVIDTNDVVKMHLKSKESVNGSIQWPMGNHEMGIVDHDNLYIWNSKGEKRWKSKLPFNAQNDYRYHQDGEWVVLGVRNQLHFFDLKNQYLLPPVNLPKSIKHIIDIYRYQNKVWVGTRTGMHELTFTGTNFREYTVKTYLNNYNVSCAFVDREQNLWISTLENGAYLTAAFEITEIHLPDSLTNYQFLSIAEGHDKQLWFGSNNGFYGNIKENQLSIQRFGNDFTYNVIRIRNLGDSITAIISKGLIKLVHSPPRSDRYLFLGTSDFMYDPQGNLWMPARHVWVLPQRLSKTFESDEKVSLYELQRARASLQFHPLITYKFRRSFAVETDNDKQVWMSTQFGLFRFVLGPDNTRTEYPVKAVPEKANYLWYQQDKELLWVCSDTRGLLALRGDHVVYQLSTKNGLYSNTVKKMLIDHENRLWVATSNGVNVFTLKGEIPQPIFTVFNYTHFGEKINDLTVTKDKVYLARDKGLTILDLDKISPKLIPPVLYITGVTVGDSTYSAQQPLSFPHNKNNIRITFEGLSFTDIGNINYQYRLLGWNDDWLNTNRISLTYEALPPGTYTFELRAINNRNIVSPIKTVMFIITPPFWSTIWFIILMIVCALLGIYLVYRWRMNILTQQFQFQRQIMVAQNEKLALERDYNDLEMKALRMQMNPHFIFNALNTIKGYYVEDKIREANQYISMLSRLLRIVLEQNEKYIPLHVELEGLGLYVKMLQHRHGHIFDLEIQLQPGLDEGNLLIPPMLLQPMVENAIQHGLVPKAHPDGRILLKFLNKNEDLLEVHIVDNGIGRSEAQKRQKHKIHRSIALELTRKRLELTMPPAWKHLNPLLVEDLYDAGGHSNGTLVKMLIPFQQNW